MRKIKHHYSWLFGLFALLSGASVEALLPDDAEAFTRSFYQNMVLNKHDFRTVDFNYLSDNLASQVKQVITAEQTSSHLFNQQEPDGKSPFLIENDFFTSLYEGAKSFVIVDIVEGHNDAVVTVELSYDDSEYNKRQPTVTTWQDKLLLIKENNQWKVDNVIFGQEAFNLDDWIATYLLEVSEFYKENGHAIQK